MANTAYKWRENGSTSSQLVSVTVSNLASDNSGVAKLAIVGKTGNLSIAYDSGGSSEPGKKSYTSAFLVTNSNKLTTGYESCSFTTQVTWGNGGTTSNSTTQTVYLCEPAGSMNVNANDAGGVWSTYTGNISVTRTFAVGPSGSGASVWGNSGTTKFTSGDASYVTIDTTNAVTSTTAKLASLGSKIINRSKEITITGTSTSGAPNAAKSIAAPKELSGTDKITIKNATDSIALSLSDTHLYAGATATATVKSTPHANGSGSVVYSNELTSIASNKTGVATVSAATKASNNTNSNTFTVTAVGAGVASISVSSTPEKVGKDVSASAKVVCSSLPSTTNRYTYVNGAGTLTVSNDTKQSVTDDAKATLTGYSKNIESTQAYTLTYTGKAAGVNTITMASGAQVKITCSNLNATQKKYTYVNGSGTMTISYDKFSQSSDSNKATLTGNISQTTASATATYTGKASGTNTVTMASGAQVVITCSSLNATQTKYTYTGGKGSFTVNNDEISGTTSWATLSGSTMSYSGVTGGSSGTVTMRSGAKVYVVCSSLKGAGQNKYYIYAGQSASVPITNDLLGPSYANGIEYGDTYTYFKQTTTTNGITLSFSAKPGVAGTTTLGMRSGTNYKIIVSLGNENIDKKINLNAGDTLTQNVFSGETVGTNTDETVAKVTISGTTMTVEAKKAGNCQCWLGSGHRLDISVTNITVDVS